MSELVNASLVLRQTGNTANQVSGSCNLPTSLQSGHQHTLYLCIEFSGL